MDPMTLLSALSGLPIAVALAVIAGATIVFSIRAWKAGEGRAEAFSAIAESMKVQAGAMQEVTVTMAHLAERVDRMAESVTAMAASCRIPNLNHEGLHDD